RPIRRGLHNRKTHPPHRAAAIGSTRPGSEVGQTSVGYPSSLFHPMPMIPNREEVRPDGAEKGQPGATPYGRSRSQRAIGEGNGKPSQGGDGSRNGKGGQPNAYQYLHRRIERPARPGDVRAQHEQGD